jgi:hypothetical protein
MGRGAPPINKVGGALARAVALACALAASGCLADLVPLYGHDGGGGGQEDLAGLDLVVPPQHYTPDIMNDMTALGCGACHNGSIPMQVTYADVSARAMSGEMSLILVKNLATSGVAHGGGHPFKTTSDPTYVRWLAWINAGAPQ